MAAVDVNVPRMGSVNASWLLDLGSHADATGEVVLSVAATASSTANIALPLVCTILVYIYVAVPLQTPYALTISPHRSSYRSCGEELL